MISTGHALIQNIDRKVQTVQAANPRVLTTVTKLAPAIQPTGINDLTGPGSTQRNRPQLNGYGHTSYHYS